MIFVFECVDDVGAVLRHDEKLGVCLARVIGELDDEIDHAGGCFAFILRIAFAAVRACPAPHNPNDNSRR